MHNRSLWAITSYFNPCLYKRRLDNYRTFRKHLNVPLVTVELTYNGKFQLESSDADILIQLKGNDMMWQKERLLNVALKHLPESCQKVAWIDCDIIFDNNDWIAETVDLLDTYKLIQPFKKAYHLPAEISSPNINITDLRTITPIYTENSFAYHFTTDDHTLHIGRLGDVSLISGKAIGMLWAIRKDILLQHGLYDFCIVGGGDSAVAFAASGRMHALPQMRPMNPSQIEHYYKWAMPFYDDVKGSISFLKHTAYHLWHGEFADRGYKERHGKMIQFDFNPYRDIIEDEEGCWRWANGRVELQDYLRDFFTKRKEDG